MGLGRPILVLDVLGSSFVILLHQAGCVQQDKRVVPDRHLLVQGPEVLDEPLAGLTCSGRIDVESAMKGETDWYMMRALREKARDAPYVIVAGDEI